jgi:hypothetical protein
MLPCFKVVNIVNWVGIPRVVASMAMPMLSQTRQMSPLSFSVEEMKFRMTHVKTRGF